MEGSALGRERVKLSHLQFAGVTLFSLKRNEEKFICIVNLIELFGCIWGFKGSNGEEFGFLRQHGSK